MFVATTVYPFAQSISPIGLANETAPLAAGQGPRNNTRSRSIQPLTNTSKILARVIKQALSYRASLMGLLVLSIAAAPLALLLPLPLKIAVDNVIGSKPVPAFLTGLLASDKPSFAATMLAIAAGLLVLTTLLLYVQSLSLSILQTYIGEKLVLEFRTVLFQHLQRLSLSYHDTRGSSDSNYRIQYDAPCIQYVLVTGGLPLFTSVVTLFGMLTVTLLMDLQLALIALAVCPVLFCLTRVYGARLRRQWHELKIQESSAMSVIQEALSAIRVVKAFGREEHEQERFTYHSNERLRSQLRVAYLGGSFDLFVGLTIALGTAATLVVGVWHVQAGTLTVGSLLVLMAYLAQIYEPLKTISKKLGDVQSGLASAERAFALLDEVPEVPERAHTRPLSRAAGGIEFRNVSFAYPEGQEVLHNISLIIKPGTRVGIAGQTGSGKSTLMSLLMRFYDPCQGEILLDGVALPEYKLADLRKQFAMVLQDPVLFSATIRENIAYAKPGATEEEICDSAKLANAHDFIMSLPDRYETAVGERGMRLSGGERQRISLARAFLKDAPILILDEPTSSVDVSTEAVILNALERLMAGRTTFIIAHRLATLENCNPLTVLEHGRLQARTSDISTLPLQTRCSY
jgi:ATP-binding cassette subfamily B protein